MGNDRLSGKQVGSQVSRRVTRRLAWIQPVCISINAVPELKGLMKVKSEAESSHRSFLLHLKPAFSEHILILTATLPDVMVTRHVIISSGLRGRFVLKKR